MAQKVDGVRLKNIKTKYTPEALEKNSSLKISASIILSIGIRLSQIVSY